MKVDLKELDYSRNFEDIEIGETFLFEDYLYLKVQFLDLSEEPVAVDLETNTIVKLDDLDICHPIKTKVILDN